MTNNPHEHPEELELGLIGALYTDPFQLGEDTVAALEPGDMSVRAWGWLEGLKAMFDQVHDLDTLLLKHILSDRFEELGGYAYLGRAQNVCMSSQHATIYAGTLLRVRRERRKRALAAEIAKGGDIRAATQELQDLSAADVDVRTTDWRRLVHEGHMRQQSWQEFPSDVRGWETGIPRLDRVLGGVNAGLISIYGATSMGKSTLARQLAISFARSGAHVIMAPTEMAPADVLDNLAGEMAGIPVKRVRGGSLNDLEKRRLHQAMQELYGLDIIPVDDPAPTPDMIRAFVRAKIREGRCSMVIVDSGSNLRVPEGRGEIYDETRIAAGVLKDIAYEHDIPVIATWQIGRSDKNRSPIPRIGDAKGASDVEYNSHVVISIFRPYYYRARGIALPEPYNTCQPADSYLSVLKDRSGGAGDDIIRVMFMPGKGFVGVDEASREASA